MDGIKEMMVVVIVLEVGGEAYVERNGETNVNEDEVKIIKMIISYMNYIKKELEKGLIPGLRTNFVTRDDIPYKTNNC